MDLCLMTPRSRFLEEHANSYALSHNFATPIQDPMRCRKITSSVSEEVNLTSQPTRVANYLKPVISTEGHKRMGGIPLECLANEGAFAVTRSDAYSEDTLYSFTEMKDLLWENTTQDRSLESLVHGVPPTATTSPFDRLPILGEMHISLQGSQGSRASSNGHSSARRK
ncbi:hypothetical protein HAX54_023001, partial [Datura stramonium]|nr:hypothetical protein [Datura stramonium]